MRFVALATDYDDTLADGGSIDQGTLKALQNVKRSGFALLLVTGRRLLDLRTVLPEIDLFDLVVAENGAVLFNPKLDEETLLADAPPQAFVQSLLDLGVAPMEIGRVIVATREKNEDVVLKAIMNFGLEHHIVFNKGAVMVLPPNVNKATGLQAALAELRLKPENVVGIGDAENDHAFLSICGLSVAVGNALPSLIEKADLVVKPRGQGVVEVANRLVAGDLPPSPRRAA